MSITDELRRYAANWGGWFYDDKDGGLIQAIGHVPAQSTPVPKVINAIADRIDIEHARAVMSAMNDALYHANDESMAELGWLRLPKDADGVSIYVGDRLDGYGKTIEVVELRYGRSGWVIVSRDGNAYADTFAFTHHHEPTVEDVLDEFFGKANLPDGTQTRAEIIAEYAAKLRLAGEAE